MIGPGKRRCCLWGCSASMGCGRGWGAKGPEVWLAHGRGHTGAPSETDEWGCGHSSAQWGHGRLPPLQRPPLFPTCSGMSARGPRGQERWLKKSLLGQISLLSLPTAATTWSLSTPEPMLHNEKPLRRKACVRTTRESPCATAKTQHSKDKLKTTYY